MKVCLLAPSPERELVVGYGVRIISACLKEAGHSVKIVFLPKPPSVEYAENNIDEILSICADADLVGVSLMTDDLPDAIQITRAVKNKYSVPVIWGGIHPTMVPEPCMEHADIVCVGEAEKTIVELVDNLEAGIGPEGVSGLWFRGEDGSIIENRPRANSLELDAIPFQDYDIEDHYLLYEGRVQKVDMAMMADRVLEYFFMTLTARGCPYRCTFCWNHVINEMNKDTPIMRFRSPANVVEELKLMRSKFPFISFVNINDDAFFMRSYEEIVEFCDLYKAEIGVPFIVTGATPSTLTRDKLAVLVQAGMTDIRMGVQSGSARIKKMYKRFEPNKKVKDTVTMLNEFKKYIPGPKYDMIVDNFWETDEERIETIKFMADLPVPYYMILFPLTFYPGTELYDNAKAEGKLPDRASELDRDYKWQRTYLNQLLQFVNINANVGRKLSKRTIQLLTNRRLIKWKLNWPLFGLAYLNFIVAQKGQLLLDKIYKAVSGKKAIVLNRGEKELSHSS